MPHLLKIWGFYCFMDDLVAKVEKIETKQDQPSEIGTATPSVDSFKYDENFAQLSKYFKVDPNESNWYQDKIQAIHEWAKEKAQSKDILDVLLELKALERELGTHSDLEKRVNNVYRWIRLDQDEKRIQKEKKVLANV